MPFEDDLRRYLRRRPSAPAPAILATRLLMRAAALLRARMDAALAGQGLRMREYLALAFISLHKGQALRPSELSVSLDATRPQVTRLLDALGEQGLVERQAAADDRRALQLVLTEAGLRRLAACAPLVHEAYRDAWAGVPDLEPVLRDLRALNQCLLAGQDATAGGGGAAP
ncbi:MarR family transcriptional regulator [Ramlibacter sp. H39-3-26]|uniref:MarR family winged helix-turn-helix transcriptional regulator n=1 Tax=Curvibacter soli TaxID=3031331 RepID=UPI0023DA0489|nr:MarR family transcriptional regulator [Ramlibacter sp. H39-3-26]MDF1484342.1 MarR family transcriptional regulator [Ramlibacter sp. H39-3-26]